MQEIHKPFSDPLLSFTAQLDYSFKEFLRHQYNARETVQNQAVHYYSIACPNLVDSETFFKIIFTSHIESVSFFVSQ